MRASFFLFLSILIFSSGSVEAQKATTKVFPKGDKVLPAGVAYHPDLVPEKQWDADLANIAKLGFVYVQMGKGAWPRFEPREGANDFTWMDRCIDLATRHKLKVVLCPGTDIPPTWLIETYPYLEATGPNGMPYQARQRCASLVQPLYRRRVERITTAFAKRFGDNTTVIGWIVQENTLPDFGDTARAFFQAYMREKAKFSLDSLNRRWDNPDGSQVYSDWSQIHIPNPAQGIQNKYESKDFEQFIDGLSLELIQTQLDILKRFTLNQFVSFSNSPAIRIPTVLSPKGFGRLHLFDVRDQDFPSVSNWANQDRPQLTLMHALVHSSNPHMGLAGFALEPQDFYASDGNIRLAVWREFGLGVDFFTSENYTGAITHPASQTLTHQGSELLSTLLEIELLKGYRMKEAVEPLAISKRKVAVVYTDELLDEGLNNQFKSPSYRIDPYDQLRLMGAPLVFIPPGREVDPQQYPVLIVPHFSAAGPKDVANWRKYVQRGGNLLIYQGVGRRPERGPLQDDPYGSTLGTLTGVTFKTRPQFSSFLETIMLQGKLYNALQAAILQPLPGYSDSVKSYAAYYLKPTDTYHSILKPDSMAVAERRIGKGRVIYLGAEFWEQDNQQEYTCFSRILQDFYSKIGATPLPLPPNVYADWHEGLLVITNFSEQPYSPPFPEIDRIIGHGPVIEKRDVGVYKLYK